MPSAQPRRVLTRPATRGLAAVLLAAAGAGARPAHAQTAPPARAADSTRAFVGTWTLSSTNLPPAQSHVFLNVGKADTGYAVWFKPGPAGHARSARVVGDSLVIVWVLPEDAGAYRVALRARGDSVAGTWVGPEGAGLVLGSRRHEP